MVAWYGSFNEYLNSTCCTRPSFGGKVTTGVLCLAAGTVAAGTVVVGIVVAGTVVAGTVVAGTLVAGTVVAGIVVAGTVVVGERLTIMLPDESNLTTYASSSPADVNPVP
jgi:hypothetical protein